MQHRECVAYLPMAFSVIFSNDMFRRYLEVTVFTMVV